MSVHLSKGRKQNTRVGSSGGKGQAAVLILIVAEFGRTGHMRKEVNQTKHCLIPCLPNFVCATTSYSTGGRVVPLP